MIAFLLATLLLWPHPQTISKNGTMEGTVTRFGTGDPISDVEIVMKGKGGSTEWLTPQAISDSKGHFVIEDIPPGSYSIRAQRMGYANPAPNGVRVLEGGATRTVTVISGKRTEDADLTMVQAGAISGRVLDSAGKPAVNLIVRAYLTDGSINSHGMTDDHGDYHIVDVPPGKSFLSIDTGQTKMFYPGVSDKTKATVLEISEGTLLAGLDMTVEIVDSQPSETGKTFRISGKAVDRDGNPMGGWFQVIDLFFYSPVPGKDRPYKESGGSSTGSFFFTGVPPGRYDIVLYFNNSVGAIGRVDVTVSDHDVKDIVLTPGGVNVTGQFTTTGNVALSAASIRLKMASNAIQSREMKSTTSGEFSIPNVVSGVWKISVSDLPADRALLDVRQNDISVYENGISVEDRTPASVQVILGPAGTVNGIVRDNEKGPLGAAQVFAIADAPDPARPAAQFWKTTTDGTGRFSISNVATGSYKIFTFDRSAFPSDSIPDTAEAFQKFLLPEWQSRGMTAAVVSGSKLDLSLTSIH